MASKISPEHEQFIEHELETGAFHSRGELLDEAVRLLKRHQLLRQQIQAGIDSGPSVPAGEVLRGLEEKVVRLARGQQQ